jgi:hypothetical protein
MCVCVQLVNLDEMEIHSPAEDDESEFEGTPLENVLMSAFEIKAEPRLTCISAWVQGEKKVPGKKGNLLT